MAAQSFIQKLTTPRSLRKMRFYFHLSFILVFLIILAIWLDYWLRGEIGVAKKFAEFVDGRWGTGVLIGGGILYILLLSLPFVPGVELGLLLMCVFAKEGVIFVYLATRVFFALSASILYIPVCLSSQHYRTPSETFTSLLGIFSVRHLS